VDNEKFWREVDREIRIDGEDSGLIVKGGRGLLVGVAVCFDAKRKAVVAMRIRVAIMNCEGERGRG
jgi:hypothetical protein